MIIATADNSYCTIEAAEEYFATRLHSDAWHSASEEQRNIALVQATRLFNLLLVWLDEDGEVMVVEPGKLAPIDDPALPWACCEMALDLLQDDPMVRDSMEGLSRIKLGELELEKDTRTKRTIPPHILALLARFARLLGVSGCSIPIIRS